MDTNSWKIVDSIHMADALSTMQNSKAAFKTKAKYLRDELHKLQINRLCRTTPPDTLLNLLCGTKPVSANTREELLNRITAGIRAMPIANVTGAKHTLRTHLGIISKIRGYKHLVVTKNDRHLLARIDSLNTDPGRATRIFDAGITPITYAMGDPGLIITGGFYTQVNVPWTADNAWTNVVNTRTGQLHTGSIFLRMPITRAVMRSKRLSIETESGEYMSTSMEDASGSGANRQVLSEMMQHIYKALFTITRQSTPGVRKLAAANVHELAARSDTIAPDIEDIDMPAKDRSLRPRTHNPCELTPAYWYDPDKGTLTASQNLYAVKFFEDGPEYNADLLTRWAEKYPVFRHCVIDHTVCIRARSLNIFSPSLLTRYIWQ